MKLTKQKLVRLIKEEMGKVTEGLSEEARDFIIDSIHDMLRQVEDMGFSPKWGGRHYEAVQNVILDDALDSYAHPDKENWAEPGGSEDF